jgi:hypothetical protein
MTCGLFLVVTLQTLFLKGGSTRLSGVHSVYSVFYFWIEKPYFWIKRTCPR